MRSTNQEEVRNFPTKFQLDFSSIVHNGLSPDLLNNKYQEQWINLYYLGIIPSPQPGEITAFTSVTKIFAINLMTSREASPTHTENFRVNSFFF